MPDPTERLNVALEGRYSIERELGEGGMATVTASNRSALNGSTSDEHATAAACSSLPIRETSKKSDASDQRTGGEPPIRSNPPKRTQRRG